MGDETGAFDMDGSQGVFDSYGNPIYQQPDNWDYLLGFLSQNGGALLGGLSGALAGGIGGSPKQAGTTTETKDLAPWLLPYAQQNLAMGSQTLASINPNNPLLQASQNEALKTVNGGYLQGGALMPSLNAGMDAARGQFMGLYGNSGMGSDPAAAAANFSRWSAPATNTALSQNYAQERPRQASAAFGAPQFASQSASAPFAGNQAFMGLFPKVQSTSVPYFSNPMGNMFMGGMTGAAMSGGFQR